MYLYFFIKLKFVKPNYFFNKLITIIFINKTFKLILNYFFS